MKFKEWFPPRCATSMALVLIGEQMTSTVTHSDANGGTLSEQSNIEAVWVQRGVDILRRATQVAWELGDWLIEGKDIDPTCEKAAKITGYSVSYLKNCRRVSQVFPPGLRSDRISWGAHLMLSGVSDRTERESVHVTANAHRWTQAEVKEALRNRGSIRPRKVRTPAEPYRLVQVCCPACGHVFPKKGHEVTTARDADGRQPTAPQQPRHPIRKRSAPSPDSGKRSSLFHRVKREGQDIVECACGHEFPPAFMERLAHQAQIRGNQWPKDIENGTARMPRLSET